MAAIAAVETQGSSVRERIGVVASVRDPIVNITGIGTMFSRVLMVVQCSTLATAVLAVLLATMPTPQSGRACHVRQVMRAREHPPSFAPSELTARVDKPLVRPVLQELTTPRLVKRALLPAWLAPLAITVLT